MRVLSLDPKRFFFPSFFFVLSQLGTGPAASAAAAIPIALSLGVSALNYAFNPGQPIQVGIGVQQGGGVSVNIPTPNGQVNVPLQTPPAVSHPQEPQGPQPPSSGMNPTVSQRGEGSHVLKKGAEPVSSVTLKGTQVCHRGSQGCHLKLNEIQSNRGPVEKLTPELMKDMRCEMMMGNPQIQGSWVDGKVFSKPTKSAFHIQCQRDSLPIPASSGKSGASHLPTARPPGIPSVWTASGASYTPAQVPGFPLVRTQEYPKAKVEKKGDEKKEKKEPASSSGPSQKAQIAQSRPRKLESSRGPLAPSDSSRKQPRRSTRLPERAEAETSSPRELQSSLSQEPHRHSKRLEEKAQKERLALQRAGNFLAPEEGLVANPEDTYLAGVGAASLAKKGIEKGICFPGDTLIWTREREAQPMELIQEGDEVLSCSLESQRCEFRRVVQKYESQVDQLRLLRLSNGTQIRTTEDHPFYVGRVGGPKEWRRAQELLPGDEFESLSGDSVWLERMENAEGEGPFTVYNLQVEGTETYYVAGRVEGEGADPSEGVLVHNCTLSKKVFPKLFKRKNLAQSVVKASTSHVETRAQAKALESRTQKINDSTGHSVDDFLKTTKVGDRRGFSDQRVSKGGFEQANKDFEKLVKPDSIRPMPGRDGGRIGVSPQGENVSVRPDSSGGPPTLQVDRPGEKIKVRYED